MPLSGSGHVIVQNDKGQRLAVLNIMANLFMAENENAFACADKLLAEMPLGKAVDALVLDFHGRRHRKNVRWAFIWMDVPLWWWARIPISLRCPYLQMAPPLRAMPVCAGIIIR